MNIVQTHEFDSEVKILHNRHAEEINDSLDYLVSKESFEQKVKFQTCLVYVIHTKQFHEYYVSYMHNIDVVYSLFSCFICVFHLLEKKSLERYGVKGVIEVSCDRLIREETCKYFITYHT